MSRPRRGSRRRTASPVRRRGETSPAADRCPLPFPDGRQQQRRAWWSSWCSPVQGKVSQPKLRPEPTMVAVPAARPASTPDHDRQGLGPSPVHHVRGCRTDLKAIDVGAGDAYKSIRRPIGSELAIGSARKVVEGDEAGGRLLQATSLHSACQAFKYRGKKYHPNADGHRKTMLHGLDSLAKANRIRSRPVPGRVAARRAGTADAGQPALNPKLRENLLLCCVGALNFLVRKSHEDRSCGCD